MSVASTEQYYIPLDVVDAYFDKDTPLVIEPVSGGEINQTLVVTPEDKSPYVVQRLNSAFEPEMINDCVAATEHLAEQGWEVPQVVPTHTGALYQRDTDGDVWRALTYIQSDCVMPSGEQSGEMYGQFGALLGTLHGALSTLDYAPQFRLPHFHETSYYAEQLRELKGQLPDRETRVLADEFLRAYEALPVPPKAESQLIHGDPRTNNMLFRDGRPFTYIDFDTIMLDSTGVDVGDFLRSLAEDAVHANRPIPMNKLKQAIEGYRVAARPDASPEEFLGWAVAATERIALELSMRYLNDIVNDNYFGFDPAKFPTRKANHLARIATQRTILTAFSQ